MPLVKHSARTVKTPCRSCETLDVYWFHDTDNATGARLCTEEKNRNGTVKHPGCNVAGRFVHVNATDITRGMAQGDEFVGDPATVLHSTTCTGRQSTDDVPPAASESAPPAPSTAPPAITPAQVPTPGTDAFTAFATLMSSFAPQVDEATIERMVSSKIDAMVFPHTTVYQPSVGESVSIEGAHVSLPAILRPLSVGLHVMMVGPAGTGKTHLAESAANALGLAFRSISCHPAMTPTALVGFIDAGGTYRTTAFRDCYENGGVFLFDEIDNSHPSILASMNAALANGHMEFPDGHVKRHDSFRCVGAANTYGRGADRQYVGRQALDAATLDRFAVRDVDYDESLETALCVATGLDSTEVDRVLAYCRRLRKSATDKDMRLIVSIRATVGMCKLLLAGDTFDAAAEALIYKGMSAKDRSKLNA